MNKKVKKIAIVGPESTGKSSISQALAKHYNTLWVPEYARYYCAALTEPCNLQDEINMFHGQVALEDSFASIVTEPLLICDTTFLTVKIWSDEMFGTTPQIVLDALPKYNYDLYLLMDIDLPWEDDPLRDFPDKRTYFMDIWHKELQALNARYVVVGGLGTDRIKNAIDVIDAYMEEEREA